MFHVTFQAAGLDTYSVRRDDRFRVVLTDFLIDRIEYSALHREHHV